MTFYSFKMVKKWILAAAFIMSRYSSESDVHAAPMNNNDRIMSAKIAPANQMHFENDANQRDTSPIQVMNRPSEEEIQASKNPATQGLNEVTAMAMDWHTNAGTHLISGVPNGDAFDSNAEEGQETETENGADAQDDGISIEQLQRFLKNQLQKFQQIELSQGEYLKGNDAERARTAAIADGLKQLAAILPVEPRDGTQLEIAKAAILSLAKLLRQEQPDFSKLMAPGNNRRMEIYNTMKLMYDEMARRLPGKFIMLGNNRTRSDKSSALSRIEVIHLVFKLIELFKSKTKAISSVISQDLDAAETFDKIKEPEEPTVANLEKHDQNIATDNHDYADTEDVDLSIEWNEDHERILKEQLALCRKTEISKFHNVGKAEMERIRREAIADGLQELASVSTVEPRDGTQRAIAEAALTSLATLQGQDQPDLSNFKAPGNSRKMEMHNTLKLLYAEMARQLPGQFIMSRGNRPRGAKTTVLTRTEVVFLTMQFIKLLTGERIDVTSAISQGLDAKDPLDMNKDGKAVSDSKLEMGDQEVADNDSDNDDEEEENAEISMQQYERILKLKLKRFREMEWAKSQHAPKNEAQRMRNAAITEGFQQLASVLSLERGTSQLRIANVALSSLAKLLRQEQPDFSKLKPSGQSESTRYKNALKLLYAQMARRLPGQFCMAVGPKKGETILKRTELLFLVKEFIEMLKKNPLKKLTKKPRIFDTAPSVISRAGSIGGVQHPVDNNEIQTAHGVVRDPMQNFHSSQVSSLDSRQPSGQQFWHPGQNQIQPQFPYPQWPGPYNQHQFAPPHAGFDNQPQMMQIPPEARNQYGYGQSSLPHLPMHQHPQMHPHGYDQSMIPQMPHQYPHMHPLAETSHQYVFDQSATPQMSHQYPPNQMAYFSHQYGFDQSAMPYMQPAAPMQQYPHITPGNANSYHFGADQSMSNMPMVAPMQQLSQMPPQVATSHQYVFDQSSAPIMPIDEQTRSSLNHEKQDDQIGTLPIRTEDVSKTARNDQPASNTVSLDDLDAAEKDFFSQLKNQNNDKVLELPWVSDLDGEMVDLNDQDFVDWILNDGDDDDVAMKSNKNGDFTTEKTDGAANESDGASTEGDASKSERNAARNRVSLGRQLARSEQLSPKDTVIPQKIHSLNYFQEHKNEFPSFPKYDDVAGDPNGINIYDGLLPKRVFDELQIFLPEDPTVISKFQILRAAIQYMDELMGNAPAEISDAAKFRVNGSQSRRDYKYLAYLLEEIRNRLHWNRRLGNYRTIQLAKLRIKQLEWLRDFCANPPSSHLELAADLCGNEQDGDNNENVDDEMEVDDNVESIENVNGNAGADVGQQGTAVHPYAATAAGLEHLI